MSDADTAPEILKLLSSVGGAFSKNLCHAYNSQMENKLSQAFAEAGITNTQTEAVYMLRSHADEFIDDFGDKYQNIPDYMIRALYYAELKAYILRESGTQKGDSED